MLFLLSPAKTLDYETPVAQDVPHTKPLFVSHSAELIEVLKTYSPHDIASLMSLSDKLSTLNVARYANWSTRFTAKNSKQAVLAFDGDVYDGLDANSLKLKQLEWAQDHLVILSGLYGVLRPLDWMQPYRLEMGTALVNSRGKNLYQFWGDLISAYLNERLISSKTSKEKNTTTPDENSIIVNLASQEYFKAVNLKTLKARVIECVFEDYKNGQYKVISFLAKRARGSMARFAIEHQVKTVEQLQKFDVDGYAFEVAASTSDRLVFRRQS
jgi:uncharacterized protein